MSEMTVDMDKLLERIMGDPVADHWMTEILLNTAMEIEQLLYRVDFIQRNGDGSHLASTNSVRIPLASIARKYGAPLTDGSRIKQETSGLS